MSDQPEALSLDNDSETPICGIIMPIAEMPGYSSEHWEAMLELISRGIGRAGMRAIPVWAHGAADVLHERIVRNLFEQPYAVCDISGLNPNVMLELGIRLAFGKPTIIVNDGVVRAPFDIGSIEYVEYDRGLQFLRAEDFTKRLATKIRAVSQAEDYRPFIKTFGPIDLGSPGNEAVPLAQVVLDQMASLSSDIRMIKNSLPSGTRDALSVQGISFSQPGSIIDGGIKFSVFPGTIDSVANAVQARYPDVSLVLGAKGDAISVTLPDYTLAQQHSIKSEIHDLIRKTEARAIVG